MNCHCTAWPNCACGRYWQQPVYPTLPPTYPQQGQYIPLPKGCICPVGSEATCQRNDCGRKNHPGSVQVKPLTEDKTHG